MDASLKWGLVGTDSSAREFAMDMPFVGNGQLVAVAPEQEGGACDFAERFDIPRVYPSYEELLEDDDVDALFVSTSLGQLSTNALAALNHHKAVLCAAPLASTFAEVNQLIAGARTSDHAFMEAMWTYFLPPIRRAVNWAQEGRIGDIIHIKADFGYRQPFDITSRSRNPTPGTLLQLGIFPIALSYLFLEQRPEHICVSGHRATNGVNDDVVMVFDYGEQTATLASSLRCKLPNTAAIVGTEGLIIIPDFWRARECHQYERDVQVDMFMDPRESIGRCYEIEAFGEDVLAGRRESKVVPWSTTLAVHELLSRVRGGLTPSLDT